MDGIEEFKGAMRAHGLNPPEIIEPGRIQRFPTNGKRSDDAGWCKLFEDLRGGVFGDFRSGLSETWQRVVEDLRSRWILAGLDLAQPFQVVWYNRAVADAFRLRRSGSSGRMWASWGAR